MVILIELSENMKARTMKIEENTKPLQVNGISVFVNENL